VQMAVVKALEFYILNPELRIQAENLSRSGNLQGLQAHIVESLRLRPVGPLLIRYAEEDTKIAAGTSRETIVPAGTSIILGIYSAMRDPEAMADPEEFRPGRPPEHYFTFGYGHHRCAGDRLAEVEVALILSALLQKSDLKYSNLDRPGLPFPEDRWIEYRRR
jgi:cytochrome P450